MKILGTVYTVIITIGILISCSEKEHLKPAENKGITFGTYYGLCADNCTTIYKIEDGKLFLDEADRVIPKDIPFQDFPLSDEKLNLAKEVMDAFPNELLQESESQIGCPDCADQGGYYLEWKENGERKVWRLDTNENALPRYLKPFVQKISEVIEELNEA